MCGYHPGYRHRRLLDGSQLSVGCDDKRFLDELVAGDDHEGRAPCELALGRGERHGVQATATYVAAARARATALRWEAAGARSSQRGAPYSRSAKQVGGQITAGDAAIKRYGAIVSGEGIRRVALFEPARGVSAGARRVAGDDGFSATHGFLTEDIAAESPRSEH